MCVITGAPDEGHAVISVSSCYWNGSPWQQMQKIPQWTSGDQFREGVNERGVHVHLGFFIYVNMYMSHIFNLMPDIVNL